MEKRLTALVYGCETKKSVINVDIAPMMLLVIESTKISFI